MKLIVIIIIIIIIIVVAIAIVIVVVVVVIIITTIIITITITIIIIIIITIKKSLSPFVFYPRCTSVTCAYIHHVGLGREKNEISRSLYRTCPDSS